MPNEVVKDIFLCHASEDKKDIVLPLVEAFYRAGITCWYDDSEIQWGGSITKTISAGLRNSRYVLVVFSPAFMARSWPHKELLAALNEEASTGRAKIFPLFAGTGQEQENIRSQVYEQLYLLNDTKSISWSGDPDAVAKILRPLLAGTITRVCHISSEYPPNILGGLGVHVEQLTSALGAHLDVVLILPRLDAADYEVVNEHVQPIALANVTARYEDSLSWLRFADSAADRVIRAAKPDQPSLIHCHDWVTVLAGIKCRQFLNIPLVFHLHLPNPDPLCASIENLGLVCADQVTVNSEAMYEELNDRGLSMRRKPKVIKNGVNQQVFQPGDSRLLADNFIFFAGRLVEQKGVRYLIRAFAYVSAKFPDAKLKIAGSGPDEESLRRDSTSLLVSDKIEFLGWKTARELATLYQDAAVVAVPSTYEPFGMTALEAMACKRPVVASRTGGLVDIVKHETTGFLAEPEDALDLAQWLMATLSDPGLRHQMGEAGLARVKSEGYSWPEIARQYIQLYEDLVSRPIDRSVPSQGPEFVEQIASTSRELERKSARESAGLLHELFDWSVS